MRFRIEVGLRPELADPEGEAVAARMAAIGLPRPVRVRTSRVYTFEDGLSAAEAERLARELLADRVTEVWAVGRPLYEACPRARSIEVARRPGVMDPAAGSIREALADMGISAGEIHTSKRYLIEADLDCGQIALLGRKILANESIEEMFVDREPPPRRPPPAVPFRRVEVPVRGLDGVALLDLSRRMQLSLNLEEMRAIRDYFRDIGREPTDVELETLAQTWSEHCVHKTMKGRILLKDPAGNRLGEVDNLLRSTIAAATARIGKRWCWSVFRDNAGVIEFDGETGVTFKVETHNHPSAIEPYGGAGTGVGGVIRDTLGVGLGARPIAGTDVFCFGLPDMPQESVPPGCLHPRRILDGVVSGVRDYGNRMGIPTVNGAILFDEAYTGNPLVFCGSIGILPRKFLAKAAAPGDLIVAIGGRTGRDGIHGATFSSDLLGEDSERVSSGAVQIGNPIEEKRVLDALLRARDEELYHCVTDCGAGGFSSAVGEMGADIGAEVDLEKAPLKYEGLTYSEIWISEAQERMVLAVPEHKLDRLREICRAEGVEMTVIGRFASHGQLVLRYRGVEVGRLEMSFLHEGLPKFAREAVIVPPADRPWSPPPALDPARALTGLLSSWDICSKEWVIRQYDHEVQGRTAVKPLVGAADDGPSDAAVLTPALGSRRGVAIACGICPHYSRLDPYMMALNAVDECIRNLVSVGADPERIALLDNFAWGDPGRPETLGALVRAAEGCRDAAIAFGTPFISGKDSLNNEYRVGGQSRAIPHTLLISGIGIVHDVASCVTMDLKRPGDLLYLVGFTREEFGGSALARMLGARDGLVP
ncbi:MAG: phosphoribosylformylglycinamidine synthase subunit PurL, partial [Planctomycetota bacterium]|nr:phosphoribosylformylglycinamidine synthase subunit PurL [Planctomycetota bacterium]